MPPNNNIKKPAGAIKKPQSQQQQASTAPKTAVKRPLNDDKKKKKQQQQQQTDSELSQPDNQNNTQITPLCQLTQYAWWNSINNPRFVLSPMVGQSELAYRLLLRKHGAHLTYTPMIIASQFVQDAKYRKAVWQFSAADRPLIVQFCSNDPETFVKAANMVLDQCDGVELNIGCPQDVAKRGGYGSWMMENLPNIQAVLTRAVQKVNKPITAKIRVFDNFNDTLAYVQMLANCGISLLTIHPRQRHHKEEVLADWEVVRLVKQHITHIPIVLNGDMWGPQDVAMAMCLVPTDGYMCAQGALQMPAIFETVSKYKPYNLPQQQQQSSSSLHTTPSEDIIPDTKNKKQKTATTTTQSAESLVQLSKKTKQEQNNNNNNDDNDEEQDIDLNLPPPDGLLTFVSTQQEPFLTPSNSNYFRQRKYLGVGFGPNAKNTKGTDLSTQPPTPASQLPTPEEYYNTISTEYTALNTDQKQQYQQIINKYPLTSRQRKVFLNNPINTQFVALILHHEGQVDQCKRQLQNAVEYLRLIEDPANALHHHSIAQRHFFFILFDLFQKHLDCYDKLYVAKTTQDFRDVIAALHKKAIVSADFAGCAKDNYFITNHKERPRRRDGSLGPPPWPAGGGGFNMANQNVDKGKKEKTEQKKIEERGQQLLKSIDLSRFD